MEFFLFGLWLHKLLIFLSSLDNHLPYADKKRVLLQIIEIANKLTIFDLKIMTIQSVN